METTADLLREAMARNGLDQQALAAALGADPSAVSRWLRGGRPRPGVAERLARLAGVESTYALHVMGYLPAPVDTPPGPRPLPETLLATLRALSPGELDVVHETARGLLRVREERPTSAPLPSPTSSAPTTRRGGAQSPERRPFLPICRLYGDSRGHAKCPKRTEREQRT